MAPPDRSEVSMKIRAAIKAKLEELGVYVDEELPDYIMVMVANKKSQEAMTDDLRLFLGRSATVFTKWLHDILERLHSISKGGEKEVKSADAAPAKSTEKSSSKSDKEKSKKKHHKKDKDRDRESRKRVDEPKKATKRGSDKFDTEKSQKKPRHDGRVSTPLPDAPKIKFGAIDSKKLAGEAVASSVLETNVMNDDEENDGLPLGADYSTVAGQQHHQPTSTSLPPHSEPLTISTSSSGHQRKRNVVRVKPIMKQEAEADKQPDASARPTSTASTRRPVMVPGQASVFLRAINDANRPRGAVAQTTGVRRRTVETINDDDANKESPVKEEERESRSEDGDDASDADTKARRNSKHKKHKKHKKSSSHHHTSRRVQRKSESDEKPAEVVIKSDATTPPAADPADVDGKRRVQYRESVKPETAAPPPSAPAPVDSMDDEETLIVGDISMEATTTSATAPPRVQPKFVVTMDGISEAFRSKVDSVMRTRQVESQAAAPSVMAAPVAQTSASVRPRITGPGEGDDVALSCVARLFTTGIRRDIADYERDLPEIIRQVDVIHSCIGEIRHPYQLIRYPADPIRRTHIDPKLHIYLQDSHSRRSHSPVLPPEIVKSSSSLGSAAYVYTEADESLMPMKVIHPPISISLDDDDDDLNDSFLSHPDSANRHYGSANVDLVADSPSPTASAKIPERCRFWPGCTLGDACSYTHPTTKCKSFPACPFQDKCLYLHPLCKFDGSCHRRNCPFTHTSKKQAPQAKPAYPNYTKHSKPDIEVADSRSGSIKSYAPLPVPCRFGGQCTKYDTCPFKHPKMCMYGLMCPSTHCTFMHPGGGPPPALKQRLKQRAATSKSNVPKDRVTNPQPLIDTARFKWSRKATSSTSDKVLTSPGSQKTTVVATISPEAAAKPVVAELPKAANTTIEVE